MKKILIAMLLCAFSSNVMAMKKITLKDPAVMAFQNEPEFKTLIAGVNNVFKDEKTATLNARKWAANMANLIMSKPEYTKLVTAGRYYSGPKGEGLFDNFKDQVDKVMNRAGIKDVGVLTATYRTWDVANLRAGTPTGTPTTPTTPTTPPPADLPTAIAQAITAAQAVNAAIKALPVGDPKITVATKGIADINAALSAA